MMFQNAAMNLAKGPAAKSLPRSAESTALQMGNCRLLGIRQAAQLKVFRFLAAWTFATTPGQFSLCCCSDKNPGR